MSSRVMSDHEKNSLALLGLISRLGKKCLSQTSFSTLGKNMFATDLFFPRLGKYVCYRIVSSDLFSHAWGNMFVTDLSFHALEEYVCHRLVFPALGKICLSQIFYPRGNVLVTSSRRRLLRTRGLGDSLNSTSAEEREHVKPRIRRIANQLA